MTSKTVLGWAVVNGKLPSEATAILTAALNLERGNESPRTFAAKKWVPLLCAYTGARVGGLAQLRKEDVRREAHNACKNVNGVP